jgi:ABC-type multidrug transport system fused ATPase/permease subunit
MTPAVADRAGVKAPAAVAQGAIEFEGVSFAYADGREALRGIRAAVPAGRTTAIVGRTGSGKSTLVSMMMRFYDPQAGAVKVDGWDVREVPLRWLRGQFALVSQDPVLLAGTVMENIAVGREGASREEVERAARRAQAHEFIAALPEGYETVLGERGVNLSGGQRQRIAIARAFLRDAPVLVLDEPTSAIDAHTEGDLMESLAELSRGRTTVVIAHRLSTVRAADQILVMDGGRIVERGTHDELMEAGGAYAELTRRQWGRGAGDVAAAAG